MILIRLLYNFIEIILRHKCSPVNSLHIFRAPFPKNTSGWRLLYIDFILTLTLISNRIWCSHIFTPKLSSLNNLCEIYRYSNRENCVFTHFGTKICWNSRSLAASDVFHMITQSIKLYTFHRHILKSTYVWKGWLIKKKENEWLLFSATFRVKFGLVFV